MSLSDKICDDGSPDGAFRGDDVKEFIKIIEGENNDFNKDIIALIEINNYGKDDLISKMKRLIKAHRNERDKLAGTKLI